MLGHMQYLIQYFSGLFIINCLLAIVARFVSMTAPDTLAERISTATVGVLVAYGTIFFSMAGETFSKFLGIMMGSFSITRGIIPVILGVSMLNFDDMDNADDNQAAGKEVTKKNKVDISITPLGIPIIYGPACITAKVVLQSQIEGFVQNIVGLRPLHSFWNIIFHANVEYKRNQIVNSHGITVKF
jgi:multiple antibiotic resistance protein